MGRVINLNNPTKLRNYQRRTVAELLQRLGQKPTIDDDARDMAAAIVFALREIWATAEVTAEAWEKRDFWMKAERFMRQWEWSRETAANIEDVIREEAWDLMPQLLMNLFPYFNDIALKNMQRKPEEWQGAYKKLIEAPRNTLI